MTGWTSRWELELEFYSDYWVSPGRYALFIQIFEEEQDYPGLPATIKFREAVLNAPHLAQRVTGAWIRLGGVRVSVVPGDVVGLMLKSPSTVHIQDLSLKLNELAEEPRHGNAA